MNRTVYLLAGIAAACWSVPAMAQEDARAQVATSPDEIQVEVEIEDSGVLPARRALPPRRAPVAIERIVIERDVSQAGADFARQGPLVHRYYAYPTTPGYPAGYAGGEVRQTLPLPPGARVVEFDRSAWLAECRDRLSTYQDDQRGEVIGALAGAALGGVLGNRIAGRGNRALGTVAGAVAGGVAGAAIGDALEGDPQPSAASYGECEAYLDDYMAAATAGELQGAPAYYGQEYMLIPVTVTIPQKAVYREVEASVEVEVVD